VGHVRRALGDLRWALLQPLNRRHPLKTLARWVRYETRLALSPDGVTVPFVEGTRLRASRDALNPLSHVYAGGLSELQESLFLLHGLREDELFVDAGANVGGYTVLASGVARADSIAIEPVDSTFRMLLANLRLNGIADRVEALNVGLDERPGALRFSTDRDSLNRVLLDDERLPAAVVETTTLDSVLGARAPAILKLDVEGYELPVLRGAARCLADPRLRAVIVELNRSGARFGHSDREVDACLRSHGFEPCSYDPSARRLERGRRQGQNAIYVRDLERVRSDLAEARPVAVGDHVF
jgi:FkbM family methyltransferase